MDVVAAPNPAQQEVLDLLGAAEAERPVFDVGLRGQLRAELEEAVAPAAGRLAPGDQLRVTKHALSQVHGCEARFLAEEDAPFEASVPMVRGTVAHKAVELSIHWRREPVPAELVDEALAAFEHGDHWSTRFLQGCSEVERAELRSEATDLVTKFLECFPPLRAAWRPVSESALRLDLAGGVIVLSGKVDLALGRASGTTAGKVLVDYKTGAFAPSHIDDLRFYALLEAARLGVPPRMLATYYLDGGRLQPEPVTVALLSSTVRRVADGIDRMVELRAGDRPPVKRVSPSCRWCVALPDCLEGTDHLATADDWG
ncbi:hypothetical protein BH20ACT2_BH20ACT2_08510 [soil metagenome]